jgi:hypothetical protein
MAVLNYFWKDVLPESCGRKGDRSDKIGVWGTMAVGHGATKTSWKATVLENGEGREAKKQPEPLGGGRCIMDAQEYCGAVYIYEGHDASSGVRERRYLRSQYVRQKVRRCRGEESRSPKSYGSRNAGVVAE